MLCMGYFSVELTKEWRIMLLDILDKERYAGVWNFIFEVYLSIHTHIFIFSWCCTVREDEMRWDEMRYDAMRWAFDRVKWKLRWAHCSPNKYGSRRVPLWISRALFVCNPIPERHNILRSTFDFCGCALHLFYLNYPKRNFSNHKKLLLIVRGATNMSMCWFCFLIFQGHRYKFSKLHIPQLCLNEITGWMRIYCREFRQ